MTRRPLWLPLLLVLLFCRPSQVYRQVQADLPADLPRDAPNVLILVGDDHAAGLLGIDGDPRQATPRLDALAQQGVRFDRAYCQAPVCTASRQSFLTGRLPHAVGVTQLTTPLPESAITLADWFAEFGYTTGAVGKMHFNSSLTHGFAVRTDLPDWQRWLRDHPLEGGSQRRVWRPFRDPAAVWLNAANRDEGLPDAATAATFLANQAAEFIHSHRDRPFLLVVGFPQPHSPFDFPRDLDGRFRGEEFDAPPVSGADRRDQPLVFRDLTADQVRGIQAAYFNALRYLDIQVGRVLDALDSAGVAEDTIVVYWGDNGYFLGQRGRFEKHAMYEPAVRVPLIVRWPGRIPEGRRQAELVEMVDLFPTLTDLCGLPDPPDLHGQSLAPLLRDEPGAAGRPYAFSEYPENEEAMIRDARYKLIVGTGRRVRQDGYLSQDPTPGPYLKLYDLDADPGETIDRSGDPALAGVVDRLRHALYLRLTTTREGIEPVPEGLSEIEAIHWCLVPRDGQPAGSPQGSR